MPSGEVVCEQLHEIVTEIYVAFQLLLHSEPHIALVDTLNVGQSALEVANTRRYQQHYVSLEYMGLEVVGVQERQTNPDLDADEVSPGELFEVVSVQHLHLDARHRLEP